MGQHLKLSIDIQGFFHLADTFAMLFQALSWIAQSSEWLDFSFVAKVHIFFNVWEKMVFQYYRWNTVYYRWSWRSEKKHNYLNLFKWWLGPSKLLRCIYGCQKWIPDKIPHRYSNPKIFSTFFFVRKKIIFENEQKYFSKKLFWFNFIFNKYFFQRKKKVEKFFVQPYRCGILSGIHFSHP